MLRYFSFAYRNPGHWDVWSREIRIFRIRGEPGAVVVIDDRDYPRHMHRPDNRLFRSVGVAVAALTDELMRSDPNVAAEQDATKRAADAGAKAMHQG